jgi:uncharacterized protein YkwD
VRADSKRVIRLRTLLALSSLLTALAAVGCATAAADTTGVVAYAASSNGTVHAASAGGTRGPSHRGRAKSSCRVGSPAKRRTHGSSKSHCAAATRHAKVNKPIAPRAAVTPSSAKRSAEAAANEAATIANVLATPCQNTQLTPELANLPLVRAAVLCLINTERAQNGREPLQPDSRLEAAAESHGKEMLAVDYFAHIAPSGETPVERVRGTGYIPNGEVGYVIGENLAWGTLTLSTPEAIVKAWISSPEHLANILEAKYQQTGIDVEPEVPTALAEGVQGALYTQEFGVIVH